MVVMLTYGPAMRVARLVSECRLPILLANIQPEPNVTPAWDMADMTYNQGVHGAQDTANAMVRAGRRGGPHHEVMNLGHHAAAWKEFAALAGIEFIQV
jgi:L-arabinose isomerase